MAIRQRQMRNFTLALLLSQGTPMMVMGETGSIVCFASQFCSFVHHFIINGPQLAAAQVTSWP